MPSSSPSSSAWEPPSPEDLQRLLPQYEITGILGRGGMGAVYKGRQAKLDRPVAIKVLPETFTQGEDELNFAARFLQEARAMARLDHPAIISVYDFGETADGQLYFVMEFIDGMDIHRYLQHHGGRLPQEQALAIVAHVLDALEYAHQHGIVHRDIKPANILLNHEGRVKIADFGLAKRLGDGSGDSVAALTMTNVAVGTPDFVAPEALESGRTVDHRADLYAVGVMLYQLLTGKLPRGSFQPPSVLVPDIDPRIDDIVTKATASDPDYRYPTASAIRADLDRIFSQPMARIAAGEDSDAVPVAVPVTDRVKRGGQAVPASSRGRTTPAKAQPVSPPPASRGPLYLGLGLAAAVVLGLGAFFLFRGDDPAATSPPTGTAVTPPPIAEMAKKAPPAAASPDQPKKAAPPVADATTPPTKASPEPVAPLAASTGTPSPPPAGQWTRIYSTIEDLPEPNRDPSSPRAVRMADGWIAASRPAIQVTLPLPVAGAANYGVRARFRGVRDDEALTHGIVLRAQAADPRSRVYQLRRGQTMLHCQRREADQDWTIASAPTDPLPPKKEFTLEFCVIGDRLIGRLDDGAFVIGRDGTYQKGDAFLYFNDMEVRDIEVIRLDGLPEADALRIVGVTGAADGGTPAVAAAPTTGTAGVPQMPPPPTGAPTSTPAPTAVQPAGTMPASPDPSPLAGLPGLATRLDGFHAARRTQLGDLAKKYLAGLETRLGQAADAGDLRLATAFEAEKKRVQTLQTALAEPPADPLAAVTDTRAVTLPALPEGSPEPLVALRQTWTTESGKIRTTLDAALQQSLQALEAELTRARDFEKAQAVLAWRESLAAGGAETPPRPEAPAAPMPMATAPTDEAGKSARAPASDLAAATKEKPFENSLGMKFVPVPGTEVLFCIHETRWRDYEKFAKTSRESGTYWYGQTFDDFTPVDSPEEHPVVNVSWEDASRFCAWLSKEEKITYRLPTDREWSLAVGIGHEEDWKPDSTPETIYKPSEIFPWGSDWPPPPGAGNYSDQSRKAKAPRDDADYIEGFNDGFPTTAPVRRFTQNALGIFDLGGNAWEWVDDWFSVQKTGRTVRGGSWGSPDQGSMRSSYRSQGKPTLRDFRGGFRIVVETGAPAATPAPAPTTPASAPPTSLPASDLAAATKEKPFENSLGMKFVPVPGTEVLFCIHETRWRDYAEYAESAENIDPKWQSQEFDETITKRNEKDVPVVNVSWEDAQAFCTWLSEKERKVYRLPKDKEWSVAVGIGHIEKWEAGTEPRNVFRSDEMFPWGLSWPPPAGFGNYRDESRKSMIPNSPAGTVYIDGFDDGYPGLAPVMSFPPNNHGLFDLSGNVAEWVDDWFDSTRKGKVLRGGSWSDGDPKILLSSYRNFQTADYRSIQRGFRVVVETGAPAAATFPATPPVATSGGGAKSAAATRDAPFENTLGMKFVSVPGTEVLFCIHETRWRDYAAYAERSPGVSTNWRNQTHDGFAPAERPEDHPVASVSWEDARAFCTWLAREEGRTYRLPTDREWSVAVGIGREEQWGPETTPETVAKPDDIFPWGRDWPPPRRAGNYSDQSRKGKAPRAGAIYLQDYDDGYPTTAPVMSFAANRHGLYDLSGNVWEWCEDGWNRANEQRVTRGGSWYDVSRDYLLSSGRFRSTPTNRNSAGLGFRVVLETSAAPAPAPPAGAAPSPPP